MEAAVATKPEEKKKGLRSTDPALAGQANLECLLGSSAGMPLFLQRSPREYHDPSPKAAQSLASTTDGVTTFDPSVRSHSRAAEIQAHEAVHRAQFTESLPRGSRRELEQDAQRGTQMLLAGKNYAPGYSAPPNQTLTFDPPLMPAAEGSAQANARSLSTLGQSAASPSTLNVASSQIVGSGGEQSVHYHIDVSGSGTRGTVNTATELSVTYDPGTPMGTGVGTPVVRSGEFGLGPAVPVPLYPVVIRYQRILHLTDADRRDVTVTISSNVNFTHESWARAIAGRPLTFETLLDLRGDRSEVSVIIAGTGPLQPYYADYYFNGVSLNIQSAVAESSLMAGAGLLPFASNVPARFVRAEITAGEQFDSLEAFLVSADAIEAARRAEIERHAHYPSQQVFERMTPEEKRDLAERDFWDEFDVGKVLEGIGIGVAIIGLGALAVGAAAAGWVVAAFGLAVGAIILAVWSLATLIPQMIKDIGESWGRGDYGTAILQVIKYIGLIVAIILGAILLVVAVVTGGEVILAGVAIAAIVALAVAAIASIALVFLDLDDAQNAERVEDFRHYVQQADREAEEAVINIVLLIIGFLVGPLARRFSGGPGEGGGVPLDDPLGGQRRVVPIEGGEPPVIEGEGPIRLEAPRSGTAEMETLPSGRSGIRLNSAGQPGVTGEIISRAPVAAGELLRVRGPNGVEVDILVNTEPGGAMRWRALTPQEAAAQSRGVTRGTALEPRALLPSGTLVPPDTYGSGFHGTSEVTAEVALTEGLPARGTNWSLLEHSEQRGNSAFRGTTQVASNPSTEGGAAYWAGEGGLVFDVRDVPLWDINSLLEGRVPTPGGFRGNLMYGENEMATLSRIPPERIYRYGVVIESRGRLLVGEWIPNPRYRPPGGGGSSGSGGPR